MSARHAERRRRVLDALGEHAALLIPAAPELHVGADTELRYAADPDLFYLTGYEEPEAVLLLCPGHAEAPFTLFVRPRDPERELWSGARGGIEAARDLFGADAALAIADLPAALPKILAGIDHLYYRFGANAELDRLVQAQLAHGRARRPRQGSGLHSVSDPALIVAELRVVKDAEEIERIRRACALAVEAFGEVRDCIRPGAGEWEVEALLEAGFRRRGASGPSFPTIVAAGANSTVLHYTSNRSVLRAGDVLLLDAGARLDMYCSDITRCYPVSGQFSAAQAELYRVVRDALLAGIEAARPGLPASGIHEGAVRVLVSGLVELGFLEGDPAELAADSKSYARFYPHRTSHWLGLDVHDAGQYVLGGEPRLLEPGMVLTVEPGLYIPVAEAAGPPELRGVGIRLEEDVLITAEGNEVLTAGLPL